MRDWFLDLVPPNQLQSSVGGLVVRAELNQQDRSHTLGDKPFAPPPWLFCLLHHQRQSSLKHQNMTASYPCFGSQKCTVGSYHVRLTGSRQYQTKSKPCSFRSALPGPAGALAGSRLPSDLAPPGTTRRHRNYGTSHSDTPAVIWVTFCDTETTSWDSLLSLQLGWNWNSLCLLFPMLVQRTRLDLSLILNSTPDCRYDTWGACSFCRYSILK